MKLKKHEIKRALRIQNDFLKKKHRMMTGLLIAVLCVFALPAIAAGIENPDAAKGTIVMLGGGVSLASMALVGNIEDSSDRDAAGKQIAYRVWLIAVDQIDRDVNFPDPNGNREIGTIPMKPGEVFHYFEAHDIPTDNSTAQKGDITSEYTNTFVVILSGMRNKPLDFAEEYQGRKFIIIYGECGTSNYYILGNPCQPMVLKQYDRKNDKEGRYITFTFENNSWRQPLRYVGAIITAPAVTLAPGATTLAVVANNNLYTVPDGGASATTIASVSGLSADDRGRTLTVQGSGSANAATIEENDVFILEGGATWTATAGSSIVFRVLDTNRLVEVSRVQA